MIPVPRLLALVVVLTTCCPGLAAARKSPDRGPVTVAVKYPDPQAVATRSNLLRLLARHDLARWTFTRAVVIDGDGRVIPHSHPVLTLHDRHHQDDDLLLSTYVHEQLHWFMEARRSDVQAAVAALKKLYPKVPVGFPDGGHNAESTYQHLMICHLELAAMRELLGELRAFALQRFWAQDHYRWVYRQVAQDASKIAAVIKAHGLVPGRQRTP